MGITHGSLESGIGMFDYAAEMKGWKNVFHCEINPFCQKVLKYYWPHAKSYTDVFGFDGTLWRGKVDVITCGFPCQPFSVAGKRKGSDDDRHIWPENMRIIREAKPTFVLAENVPGILTIENGMVFERVCLDLENEGYEVTPFIIPAVATDKVHRRDRVWIVAYKYIADTKREGLQKSEQSEQQQHLLNAERNDTHAADTADFRLQRSLKADRGQRPEPYDQLINGCSRKRDETWLEAATRLCRVDDGYAGRLDTQAISKSKWRTESLKAIGNTIVWEIAFKIFQSMETLIY